MKYSIPFQISFRDFPSSDSVWLAVEDRVEKLERFAIKSTKCEVVLSRPHRHSNKGEIYHVEIRLHVPGNDIFISREPARDDRHADIYVAIDDAFDILERRLEDHIRRRRGDVKHHTNNRSAARMARGG